MTESYSAEFVDDLFRHSAGQMVSALTRLLGPERLDLAEEVVQDALVKALETWPYRGVPDNPRGWLFTVARNRALDLLRRDANFAARIDTIEAFSANGRSESSDPLADDELAMLFLCCDPALSREAQVALALKTVGGFSVNEIAAAFLAEPPTIAQRIVRAKRTLVEHDVQFELLNARARERLPAVLDVLYLMFTEGYAAHEGENLTRDELCGEAIRLARLLVANQNTALPVTHALLSLLLLQASRLRAREDDAGGLVLLAQQDRALWDRALIVEGLEHLERSAHGDRITPYHTQAAIAACHAVADGEPDWPYILELYDQLMQLAPSSVVQLNRAIAVAHVHGPEAGIADLEKLATDPALRRYYLLPAALGFLWCQAGHPQEAAAYYRRALELPCNAAERRFLQQRLQECELAETEAAPRP